MKFRASSRWPFHWALRCWQGWPGPAIHGVSPPVTHAPKMHSAMIFVVASCLVSLTTAAISLEDPRPVDETLLVDTRLPVFVRGNWQIMSDEEHRHFLHDKKAERRADGEEATSTIQITVETAATSIPLPRPFDGALAANFSGENDGACPNFINDFLSDSTFRQCYPFSLLLQGSRSFFDAQKSRVRITQVLDESCEADSEFCSGYLDELANELISDANCEMDYRQQNSVVVQAYMGMRAYKTVYDATCLQDRDTDTSAYCFANAVTNLTTSSNVYMYYLPLNSTYPQRAEPSCNSCTRDTMAILQSDTSDRGSSIASTYEVAALRINEVCGPDFVNATLAPEPESGAATPMGRSSSPMLLLLPLIIAILQWLA
ncbi:hypothetical protein DL764_006077 [Monosporascus ibericus]|uniref:DUF7729 domain-containing protein n=1 Tax=Monosporascus ibericus TaxID=155417 RepID=A0A4Q4T980_9PEZI|nr:hypothetical protein DL764_006077 [Monosporascus ibericus]